MKKVLIGILVCMSFQAFGMARLATRSLFMRNLTSKKTVVSENLLEKSNKQEQKQDLHKKVEQEQLPEAQKMQLKKDAVNGQSSSQEKKYSKDADEWYRRPVFGHGHGGA